jgi:hypothetical protein
MKSSAKRHVPKNRPIMDTKIEETQKSSKKSDMFLGEKIFEALPPNPFACLGKCSRCYFYSCKQYNTYPTICHANFIHEFYIYIPIHIAFNQEFITHHVKSYDIGYYIILFSN